jgi:hypothetical protein
MSTTQLAAGRCKRGRGRHCFGTRISGFFHVLSLFELFRVMFLDPLFPHVCLRFHDVATANIWDQGFLSFPAFSRCIAWPHEDTFAAGKTRELGPGVLVFGNSRYHHGLWEDGCLLCSRCAFASRMRDGTGMSDNVLDNITMFMIISVLLTCDGAVSE